MKGWKNVTKMNLAEANHTAEALLQMTAAKPATVRGQKRRETRPTLHKGTAYGTKKAKNIHKIRDFQQ